jgi:uncharacterized protein
MDNWVAYINEEDIKIQIANLSQITFEVTDSCNLKCVYCGYGDFYDNYDERTNTNLPVEKAILLLNFLLPLWNSEMNTSLNKNVYISFYGGEPLLNFKSLSKNFHYKNLIISAIKAR